MVTGGAGFIGSHLCEALLRAGVKVTSVDNLNDFYDPRLKQGNLREVAQTARALAGNGSSFRGVTADIRDEEAMQALFAETKPDALVHLAAYAGVRPSIERPRLYVDVNLGGTMTLLECMRCHEVPSLVFASSSSVYGNNKKVPFSETDPVDHPISPYAATKKSGELLCHSYHHLYQMSVACLRFFTVYGPRQRPDLAIRKFTDAICSGREIPFFGDGSTSRDYTYIDDIIGGVMGALRHTLNRPGYEIYNLGGAQGISLSEMVETLEKALGKSAVKKYLPIQPGDVRCTSADIAKAKAELGYAPQTAFAQGISKFITWYHTDPQ